MSENNLLISVTAGCRTIYKRRGMNSVEKILLENIDKSSACFIFPTDIAASRWADHILRLKGGTLAMGKFIAWDIFKQNSIKSKVQNKKSVPSALRKIFVSRLIMENAENIRLGKEPVFTALIREKWAERAGHFTSWITGILPQLGRWLDKMTETDDIDKDLLALARRYAEFLDANGLFEPAWEIPPFNDEGKECFIFFPESLSDYGEYAAILASSRNVKTISASSSENLPGDTFFYANARGEIAEAALYIRALHEKQGIKWDSIAVCSGDAEYYEPYILREFSNRNIPYVKRVSKPLADYPAGGFFRSVIECVSRNFAFQALTALTLNRNLPWKDTESINKLTEFGIKNNCVCSWTEEFDGKEQVINVWEDAFKHPYGGFDPETFAFFSDLRRRLSSLRFAESFSLARKQYFIFRERFFDMENCPLETDLILSRCVAELTRLCEIEKDFPAETVPDPFLFFAEYLKDINYLERTKNSGVNILPYKAAAAAPFDCHITLGAAQDNLSIVHSKFDFLPKKKREKLGVFDEDASAAFINLHRFNSLKISAFFCGERAFSGFSIPHFKIKAPLKPKERYAPLPGFEEKFAPDYYAAEKFPEQKTDFLYANQINGFFNWNDRQKQAAGNGTYANKVLLQLIREKFAGNPKFDGKYSVSQASLEKYFQCSLKWLFERALNLENIQIDASLMEKNMAGDLYHAALNLFFTGLKEKPLLKPVVSDRGLSLPNEYRALLERGVDAIFSGFPTLPGNDGKTLMSSLTSRLLRAEKKQFQFNLENCLSRFLAIFAGCHIKGCEIPYKAERNSYFLNGDVDCLLEDKAEKKYIIVDFKLKNAPKRADCVNDGENGLSNFQFPMYITLAEENEKIKISTALFYSIVKKKAEVIIGSVEDELTQTTIPKKEEDRVTRDSETCGQILMEFRDKAEQFAREIGTCGFTVFESKYGECGKCDYHRICRAAYVINRETING